MEKETYEQKIHCANCGNSWIEEIEKGVYATGFFICPNCGCKEGKTLGKPDSWDMENIRLLNK